MLFATVIGLFIIYAIMTLIEKATKKPAANSNASSTSSNSQQQSTKKQSSATQSTSGSILSSFSGMAKSSKVHSLAIQADRFSTVEEVSNALREEGLESSNLIIGVDFTRSNEFQGKNTFGGRSLHSIVSNVQNPYQQVISIVGQTLEPFDDDKLIPAFGFGDVKTKDHSVFPFSKQGSCEGFKEVLAKYNTITPTLVLNGPTSFVPLINEAIKIVKQSRDFHILLIVADGQVTNEAENIKAIVEASKYPISIIMIGVGDGPWDTMEAFDDRLPERAFDNFQFVNFHKAMTTGSPKNREAYFAVNALMEIPDQYKQIRKLNLIG